MRILVTGCAGYIGRFLVSELVARGHGVIGIDRNDAGPQPLERFVRSDLLDQGLLADTLTDVDCVVHLAAARADWGLSEAQYFRDNVDATRALLDAGRRKGVKDWVFYSSVSAMGPSDTPLDEDAVLRPIEPYGQSKALAEECFRELCAIDRDMRVVIVRPSVVYGPGNPPNTNVYRLIDALFRRRFVMVGHGQVVKSTSYLENLVAATVFLMGRLQSGVSTYIYVDEPALTTRHLIMSICGHLGRPYPRVAVPNWLASALGAPVDALAKLTGRDLPITAARMRKFNRSTHFDASKIRREGFRQPVDNGTALTKTVQWYLSEVRGQSDRAPHAFV